MALAADACSGQALDPRELARSSTPGACTGGTEPRETDLPGMAQRRLLREVGRSARRGP